VSKPIVISYEVRFSDIEGSWALYRWEANVRWIAGYYATQRDAESAAARAQGAALMLPAPAPNTPLDPKTAASPVMIAIIKMRFRQHLRLAIESVRSHRERRDPMEHPMELRRAARHLGIAEGQVYVLYDTHAQAWPFLRAVQKIDALIDRLTLAAQ